MTRQSQPTPATRRKRRRGAALVTPLRFEQLEQRTLLAVFVVDSPNAEGAGTFAAALQNANGTPGLDEIRFNLPGEGVRTIFPSFESPFIIRNSPVFINGASQPGYAGQPLIRIDGTLAGSNHGLHFLIGGNTVQGLNISNFLLEGIAIDEHLGALPLGGSTIIGNIIGLDPSGNFAQPNSKGIVLADSPNNIIGGRTAAERNIISGNRSDGILIMNAGSHGNQIEGNYIGTNNEGTVAVPNGGNGISLGRSVTPYEGVGFASNNFIGAGHPDARNIISGNTGNGVWLLRGDHNKIQGNTVGLAADGQTLLPNQRSGIVIEEGNHNLIGGVAVEEANVISANLQHGISIVSYGLSMTSNRVQGNRIGTDTDGQIGVSHAEGGHEYGNGQDGIEIWNNNIADNGNAIGDTVIGGADEDDGAADGFNLALNVIAGNRGNGVSLVGRGVTLTRIEGNLIVSNGDMGVASEAFEGQPLGPTFNFIGSTRALAGNLIATNQTGVQILAGSSFIQMRGNLIQSNRDDGVRIISSASNVIGDATSAGRNIISTNFRHGISVEKVESTGNTVRGNHIGLDELGLIAGNRGHGIYIFDAPGNFVGGVDAADGNTIVANTLDGVRVSGILAERNKIFANTIGAEGMPNRNGIYLADASRNEVVGNVIVQSFFEGVRIEQLADPTGGSNVIQRNFVGVDRNGKVMANVGTGISISHSKDDIIGGGTFADGNVISGNFTGIELVNTSGTKIQGNFIGTDPAAIEARPNLIGITLLVSSSTTIRNNIVGGNENAGIVSIRSHNNHILANFIGVNASGNPIPNRGSGIIIDDSFNNWIGHAEAGTGNLIGHSATGNGIEIKGTNATNNHVVFNTITQNAQSGVKISGGANHNKIGWPGFFNAITLNGDHGVYIHGDGTNKNTVHGNLIGIDRGNEPAGNSEAGVLIEDQAALNTIGGPAGNFISKNEYGVHLRDLANNNFIVGNYIGTDGAGIPVEGAVFNNLIAGIYIEDTYGNTIGGDTDTPGTLPGNVIVNNLLHGIRISGDKAKVNNVRGNSVAGHLSGITIEDLAFGNTVGGKTSGARNRIYANVRGITLLNGAIDNDVFGNHIGTNAAGEFEAGYGNTLAGVAIENAHRNTIGGVTETPGVAPGNVFRGNARGIVISGIDFAEFPDDVGNTVQGNLITNSTSHGIQILSDSALNTIGGEKVKAGNRIAFNTGAGVHVASGVGNDIRNNQIFGNTGIGIDLAPTGITENDSRDSYDNDFGPNTLQNAPNLEFATTDGSQRVVGLLKSTPEQEFELDFYATAPGVGTHDRDGERFLVRAKVRTNRSGIATIDVELPNAETPGTLITATATFSNNTSEFSNAVKVENDTDGDGISDDMENDAPNNGDGNNDGFQDRVQPHVASFRSATIDDYVTLAAKEDEPLKNVRPLENPSPDDAGRSVNFGMGFFKFKVLNVVPGGTTEVELLLPQGIVPHYYFRYGPTPGMPFDHWYNWIYKGVSGADVNGNHVTLRFIDGGIGDDDLVDDGIITDAGAPGFPDQFTVTTTADSGTGSLRQAILNANAKPGLDTITFNLLSPWPISIRPLSPLPEVTDAIRIDGATQPGYSGVPLVEIDGSLAGPNANGLTLAVEWLEDEDDDFADAHGEDGEEIQLGPSVVRGLAINRFAGAGIHLVTGGGSRIEGNYLGTDLTGTQARANGVGVEIVNSASNFIGGRDGGDEPFTELVPIWNLISANTTGGILVQGEFATENRIEFNRIGTQADAVGALGNTGPGVLVDAWQTAIGENVIAFNGAAGIHIADGSQNAIYANSLFANAGLGIDLGASDVEANDALDNDAGANGLMNHPLLTQVASYGGATSVMGTFDGAPFTYFRVELFANSAADPSGFGEGKTRLGLAHAQTDASGHASFGINVAQTLSPGTYLTATALDNNTGDTSEFSPAFVVPVPPALTFTVNSANDADDGVANAAHTSLREAIRAANEHPGEDIILFNIPGLLRTISLLAPLPDITDPVTIDATSQPGYRGLPLVELEGSQAGSGASGLRIVGGNTTVRGLSINRFQSGNAILVQDLGGNRIEGSFLGVDLTGTRSFPTDFVGVRVTNSPNNVIGGTTAAARNVINYVVVTGFSSQETRVEGNYIGVNFTGTALLAGATQQGVDLQGTLSVAIVGNLISGGIEILSNSLFCRVEGNLLGTDVTGTRLLFGGAATGAIVVDRSNQNVIGGNTPTARNIIPAGIILGFNSSQNAVVGNYIGTDITGTVSLAGQSHGISIASTFNFIGGSEPGAGNLISGFTSGAGVFLPSGANFNFIQGNRIGTDATGTKSIGNSRGIHVQGGQDNGISGNLISGNDASGVFITSGRSNRIQGNFIGTDHTGTAPLAQTHVGASYHGVALDRRAENTLIGGTFPGEGNVISGNPGHGIFLDSAETGTITIQGNFIGTDVTGMHRLGNGGAGIFGVRSHNIVVGGDSPGAGNVISGNGAGGVIISDSFDFTSDTFAHPIQSYSYVVQGNLIGTDRTGTGNLGNDGDGVTVFTSGFYAGNNQIGGNSPGAGNIIAFNRDHGVIARFSTNNPIRGNSIFSNGLLGIVTDLDDAQATYAEAREVHPRTQPPQLTSALFATDGTRIRGVLTGLPFERYAVDLFASQAIEASGFGEGEMYLESLNVRLDASGHADFWFPLELALPVGRFITATATDPAGNTSAFSRAIPITAAVAASTIGFAAPKYLVTEHGLAAEVTVVRTGSASGTATVEYATSNGSAIAGEHYTTTFGTLTFGDGETHQTIIVPVQDNTQPGNTAFTITLSGVAGAALGIAEATATIADDDVAGRLEFSSSAYTINEGFGNQQFGAGVGPALVVTRSGGSQGRITVDFLVTAGTATPFVDGNSAGTDYPDAFGRLTFEDGQTTATILFSFFNEEGPLTFEGPETVFVTLGNPTGGATLGAITQALVTGRDDEDVGGIIRIDSATASREGLPSVQVTVLRTLITSTTVSVAYATHDGGVEGLGVAEAGSDYVATSGILTFLPGQTSKVITIPLINDAISEQREYFDLQLSDPVGGALLVSDRLSIEVIDNDTPKQFRISSGSTGERTETLPIFVYRWDLDDQFEVGPSSTVTLQYTTSDGTATAGTDYLAVSGTLTFLPGQSLAQISIPILSDTIIEGDESFFVTLSNPSADTVDPAPVPITIREGGGRVEFVSANFVAAENGSAIAISVRSLDAAGTVSYVLENGTARAGEDYTHVTGELVFGFPTQTFLIPLINDTLAEGDETLVLRLFGATNGVAVGPSATLTILDDEVVVVVNDPPSNILLGRDFVYRNTPGAWVSDLRVLDPQTSQTHAITFDDSRFIAIGGHVFLKSGEAITAADGATISLAITATDNGVPPLGLTKTFVLNVVNLPVWPCAYQNAVRPMDVSGDGIVAPLDALLIINELNALGPRNLPSAAPGTVRPPYYDVSCDNLISPLDAVLVINALNSGGSGELPGEAPTDTSTSWRVAGEIASPATIDASLLEFMRDWDDPPPIASALRKSPSDNARLTDAVYIDRHWLAAAFFALRKEDARSSAE